MRNRFGASGNNSGIRYVIIAVAVMLALIMGFSFALNRTSKSTMEREKTTLEDAVYRSISHCYAIEGTYPESLEYLKSNYGLTYDERTFFVDYMPIGGNVMPDVTIIVKGEGDAR